MQVVHVHRSRARVCTYWAALAHCARAFAVGPVGASVAAGVAYPEFVVIRSVQGVLGRGSHSGSGPVARLVRCVRRCAWSGREFAGRLGISARAISKWESPTNPTLPRADSQAMLDTMLAKASEEQRARFELFLASADAAEATEETIRRQPTAGQVKSAKASLILVVTCLLLAAGRVLMRWMWTMWNAGNYSS